jgi:large subunit ribosomal protein L5e
MPFVKVQKSNVYSKRFQVKFRRRRIGKTDYYQRKRLILQRKNKYNTAKWRFVVRRTNQRIICQVVWSTIQGDKVKSSADSFELKKWGVTAGLTNYASAYATGLLCARRLLALLDKENEGKESYKNLSTTFDLKTEPGEDVDLKELCEQKNIEKRPFTCYLDLGLARATKGNRVFAAMKGAIDGGINIPHSDSIFPSPKEEEEEEPKKGKGKPGKSAPAKKDKKKGDENENMLRDRIFGVHVQKYMDLYEKKKDGKQDYQFSKLKECLNKAGVKTLEDLYKKVHEEIRKNPLKEKKKKIEGYKRDTGDPNVIVAPDGKKFIRNKRLTNAQRKENVRNKIAEFLKNRK